MFIKEDIKDLDYNDINERYYEALTYNTENIEDSDPSSFDTPAFVNLARKHSISIILGGIFGIVLAVLVMTFWKNVDLLFMLFREKEAGILAGFAFGLMTAATLILSRFALPKFKYAAVLGIALGFVICVMLFKALSDALSPAHACAAIFGICALLHAGLMLIIQLSSKEKGKTKSEDMDGLTMFQKFMKKRGH